MKEKHILASTIKNREAFTAVADHIERGDFSEQGWIIWTGIRDYYDADASCSSVDEELLATQVARKVSADKHKDMFRNLIAGIASFDVSERNVVADLLDTKREVVANQLAHELLSGEGNPNGLIDRYTELLDADTLGETEEEDARIGYSVEALVSGGFNKENLIEVYPVALNDRLEGGVKPGHHLILFARPEMGKTMLTIEMMAGFARQGLTVLYIGNEDPIDDINMRVVNRLSGMTKIEVLNNPLRADAKVREVGYENIILKALAPGSPREITQLIETFRPHVLVIDQLRNLNMGQDNYVLKLEQAATQARQWAKQHSLVCISVTQAGDSASGKTVLDLGDVDYSNTGIPGQADVMIGIGANENQMKAGEIVISLPKNKVSGRHEYFACMVEPQLSKIISI